MNERITHISATPELGKDCVEDVLIGLGILGTPVPLGAGQKLVPNELSAHAVESAKEAPEEKCAKCLGRSSCALLNIGRGDPITRIFNDANVKGNLTEVKVTLAGNLPESKVIDLKNLEGVLVPEEYLKAS